MKQVFMLFFYKMSLNKSIGQAMAYSLWW